MTFKVISFSRSRVDVSTDISVGLADPIFYRSQVVDLLLDLLFETFPGVRELAQLVVHGGLRLDMS